MKWCGKELLKFSFGQQDYEQLQCAIWTQALEQERQHRNKNKWVFGANSHRCDWKGRV